MKVKVLMPINDTIASCSGSLISGSAVVAFFACCLVTVALGIAYLDGKLERAAHPKVRRARPRPAGSGAHNCEIAAWNNLLSDDTRDQSRW